MNFRYLFKTAVESMSVKGGILFRSAAQSMGKIYPATRNFIGKFFRPVRGWINRQILILRAYFNLASTHSLILFSLGSLMSFPLTTYVFFQNSIIFFPFSYIALQMASFTLLSCAVLLLTKRLSTFFLTLGPGVLGEILTLSVLTIVSFVSFSSLLSFLIPLLPWGFYLLLWCIFFFLLSLPFLGKSIYRHRSLLLSFYEKKTHIPSSPSLSHVSFDSEEHILYLGLPEEFAMTMLYAPSVIGYLKDSSNAITKSSVPCLGSLDTLETLLSTFYKKNIGLSRLLISQRICTPDTLRFVCNIANQFNLKVWTRNQAEGEEGKILRLINLSDFVLIPQNDQPTWDYGRTFKAKRLLITGAGTLSGNRIAEQIASFHPAHVHLMGSSPYALRKLHDTLLKQFPKLSLTYSLDCLLDPNTLTSTLTTINPDHVLHLGLSEFIPILDREPQKVLEYVINGTQNLCASASSIGVKTVTLLSQESVFSDSLSETLAHAFCEQYFQNQDVAHQLKSENSRFLVVRSDPVLDEIESLSGTFLKTNIPHSHAIVARHTDQTYTTVNRSSLSLLRAIDLGGRPSQGPGNLFLIRSSAPIPLDQLIQDMTIITTHKTIPLKQPLSVIEEETVARTGPKKAIVTTPYQGLYKIEAPFMPLQKINKLAPKMQHFLKNQDSQGALTYLTKTFRDHYVPL